MNTGLLAVVPARKGSQRLPDKNFKLFGQEPLYLRALNQALSVDAVAKVVFSTDESPERLNIPKGVLLDQRPSTLSGAEASSLELANYLWQKYGEGCSGVLWLQPTSPLRQLSHVNEAIDLWQGQGIVISCCLGAGKHARFIDNHKKLQESGPGDPVRLNGAIYVVESEQLGKKDWIIGSRPYLMSADNSVDIDSQEDWDQALEMLENL